MDSMKNNTNSKLILYCKYLQIDPSLPKSNPARELINGLMGRYKLKTEDGYVLEDGTIVNKNQVLIEVNPQVTISERKNVIQYLKKNGLTQIKNGDKVT